MNLSKIFRREFPANIPNVFAYYTIHLRAPGNINLNQVNVWRRIVAIFAAKGSIVACCMRKMHSDFTAMKDCNVPAHMASNRKEILC
jgi:hypothetical protein